MQKGQYIRLLIAIAANPTTVVAAAKQMALHGSAQTENSTTKDTTGSYEENEVVGLSYDISGSGLILSDNDALLSGAISLNEFEEWLKDQLLYWKICVMEGDNNRTVVSTICSGTGKLTNLQMAGQNRQAATYNYTITGYDTLEPGEMPTNSDI